MLPRELRVNVGLGAGYCVGIVSRFGIRSFQVVSATEVLLKPHVSHDKEIPATHLLNFQFGFPRSSIAPRNRHDSERIAAHNRFQGEFDSEIEMRGKERSASVKRRFTVCLESIRDVV